VSFSKTGRTLYYKELIFQRQEGFKSNFREIGSGEDYWISGCRKDGADRLDGERLPIHIDDEVREEYWLKIRGEPENINRTTA